MSTALRYEQGDAALLVHREWCKGCSLCVESCPAGILSLDAVELIVVGDMSKCIFCGVCAVRCPDFVFAIERTGGAETRPAAAAGAEP